MILHQDKNSTYSSYASKRLQSLLYKNQNPDDVYNTDVLLNAKIVQPQTNDENIPISPAAWYYRDMQTQVPPTFKTVISQGPDVYNDVYLRSPDIPIYRSWDDTAVPTVSMMDEYRTFYPRQTPVAVGPVADPRLWEADLNRRMYERQVIQSAEEQPYMNWNRRQRYLQLLAKEMPCRDRYMQRLTGPGSDIGTQIQNHGPPATTMF